MLLESYKPIKADERKDIATEQQTLTCVVGQICAIHRGIDAPCIMHKVVLDIPVHGHWGGGDGLQSSDGRVAAAVGTQCKASMQRILAPRGLKQIHNSQRGGAECIALIRSSMTTTPMTGFA